MPSVVAALGVRSTTRPRTYGPRSLMRTTTDRPLRRLVTRMRVLNGKLRDAAVSPSARKLSPLAVRKPAYHEAKPMRSLPLARHRNGPARRSYMRRATAFGGNDVGAFCVIPASVGATIAASARGAANPA